MEMDRQTAIHQKCENLLDAAYTFYKAIEDFPLKERATEETYLALQESFRMLRNALTFMLDEADEYGLYPDLVPNLVAAATELDTIAKEALYSADAMARQAKQEAAQ